MGLISSRDVLHNIGRLLRTFHFISGHLVKFDRKWVFVGYTLFLLPITLPRYPLSGVPFWVRKQNEHNITVTAQPIAMYNVMNSEQKGLFLNHRVTICNEY